MEAMRHPTKIAIYILLFLSIATATGMAWKHGAPKLLNLSNPSFLSSAFISLSLRNRSTRFKIHSSITQHETSSLLPYRRFHHRYPPCLVSFSTSSSSTNEVETKARVVFLGTPDVAADSLSTIVKASENAESPFEVVGVVTQPPKRRKRRGKPIPSPVGEIAEELGLHVLCPEKAKDPEFLDELEYSIRPDLCITAAYGQYLPKRFLGIPKLGTINIHPSLLPKWRGASPVQRSLEAGENPVGVTILFTVSKMDAGPIITQKTYTINENDQATFVLKYLFEKGTELLLEVLPDVISEKITMETAMGQKEEDVTLAKLIDAKEGELKIWKESARECHDKVRGFSIWPGTFFFLNVGDDDELVKVKVIETRVVGDKGTAEPTKVIELGKEKNSGLMVVCGDGSVLELFRVQPVTRKVMDAKSFVNGLQGKMLRWAEMPEEEEG